MQINYVDFNNMLYVADSVDFSESHSLFFLHDHDLNVTS